jgi:PIG-X / PBN1
LPPGETCALHAYLTLPSFVFIDKYQLSDPLFLASQNLNALHAISGATDLEAPDWVVKEWGSAALLELAEPPTTDSTESWNVSIPLHLRYLSPTNHTAGFQRNFVPWPAVFWACTAEEGSKFAASPFDRVNLGYDGSFGPKTMFYHLSPSNEGLAREILDVPVMDLDQATWAESGTMIAIVLGTLWILWKLLQGVWTDFGREGAKGKGKKQ